MGQKYPAVFSLFVLSHGLGKRAANYVSKFQTKFSWPTTSSQRLTFGADVVCSVVESSTTSSVLSWQGCEGLPSKYGGPAQY